MQELYCVVFSGVKNIRAPSTRQQMKSFIVLALRPIGTCILCALKRNFLKTGWEKRVGKSRNGALALRCRRRIRTFIEKDDVMAPPPIT